MSNIRAEIADLFRHAVAQDENIINDFVNWDFVEADVLIELSIDRVIEEMGSLEEFYSFFSQLVDLHLAMEAA